MADKLSETLVLATPRGHEVVAELDYTDYSLRYAKAINRFTGVVRPIENEVKEVLARALRARQIYEEALSETQAIERKVQALGEGVLALGKSHPVTAPYWYEAEQHQSIARDMSIQAQRFHDEAMQAIDAFIDE